MNGFAEAYHLYQDAARRAARAIGIKSAYVIWAWNFRRNIVENRPATPIAKMTGENAPAIKLKTFLENWIRLTQNVKEKNNERSNIAKA